MSIGELERELVTEVHAELERGAGEGDEEG
jgi:hypothetical protein